MFFTPLDIQNAEFKKSMYGYSDEEVDMFLDKVMNDYQEMRKEIDDLQGKVSILNDGMKQYKNMETSLKETLILAQQTAEEVREDAVKKADNIIKEAELKADEIVQGARYKLFELNQTLKELKIHALSFKSEYMSKLQSEIALLEQMVVEDDYDIKVDNIEKPSVVSTQNDFAKEAKEKIDAIFEDDMSAIPSVETVDVALSNDEPENIEIDITEVSDEDDVELEEVDIVEPSEVAEELAEETVEDILDEILAEDIDNENSFRNRLFRRRATKIETEESAVATSTEYKARFIADLDSDEVADSKRAKREEEKNGEIKKWFLDD